MTAEAEIVVQAAGVAQKFGARLLYKGVNLAIRRGEIYVILGGSGCGKSTLMRQLIGLLKPSEGEIEVLGRNVYTDTAAVQDTIGVMFQAGALFGSMTLLENIMLPLEMHTDLPPSARAEIAAMKLALVGLADAAGRMPAQISGGMAKRAAIARALALDPPLMFLDEPSAGLDPVTSAGLDRLILDLRRDLGVTFVVVTHELASILAIADRCLMLDGPAQGVIAEGDPRVLRDSSDNKVVHAFFAREMLDAPAGDVPDAQAKTGRAA
jgi:phospholipid/cholesterol/gamma-HCH transport system ATP-binding protein